MDWKLYLSKDRFRTSSKSYNFSSVDKRTAFESDYGRVTFCTAIRRMHDKAQVIPLTSGDSVMTRLTHSLEVMSIVESLVLNYCRREDFKIEYKEHAESLKDDLLAIAKSAAFVHDVGNPPFGHFGETIIQNYFKDYLKTSIVTDEQSLDFTQFDGNAQGFRVLTKLQYIGSLDGLNLTYATLGAYMKYPNMDGKNKYGYIGSHKHGVFCTEKDVFNKLVESCHMRKYRNSILIKRHPLAFLVEAADSIAYSIMDIEDGFHLGWYNFDTITHYINKYIEDHAYIIGFDILKKIGFDKTVGGGYGLDENIIPNENRKMADFRVKIIDYLVALATQNFIKHLNEIEDGSYNKELIEDDPNMVSLALRDFAGKYIFVQKDVQLIEMTGESVITGLLDMLIHYAFHPDAKYREKFKNIISKARLKVAMHEYYEKYPDDYGGTLKYCFFSPQEIWNFDIAKLDVYSKLRVIVDFISGMTDKFAVELYQKLSGQRL